MKRGLHHGQIGNWIAKLKACQWLERLSRSVRSGVVWVCLALLIALLLTGTKAILLGAPAYAQTPQLPEVKQLWQKCYDDATRERYQAALSSCQALLELSRAVGDRTGEAVALNNLGNTDRILGQYSKSISHLEQALQITRELGNRNGETMILDNLGLTYQRIGKYPKAINYHQQSLQTARQIGDRNSETYALKGLGNAYMAIEQYPKAINYHQQSLQIARQIGDRNSEAYALNNLGLTYQRIGEYPKAIDYLEQSLQIKREMGDRSGEANSLIGLGLAYQDRGQYSKVLVYLEQALKITRELGNRSSEAIVLGNLGRVYISLGKYSEAINYYQQSLIITRELGERNKEAIVLGSLGGAYNALGQNTKAISYLEQAMQIKRELSVPSYEIFIVLGDLHQSLGKYSKAINYLEQALQIAHKLGNRLSEAKAYNELGNAYSALGQYLKAINHYQQALQIGSELGHRIGEASSLNGLGNAYSALEQYQKAINYYQQTLLITSNIRDHLGEVIALSNLGRVFLLGGKLEQAEQNLRASIMVFEQLRPELQDTEKLTLFEIYRSPYVNLQEVLIAQNQPEAALEIAERGRARAFVELLAQRLAPDAPQALAAQVATPPTLAQIRQVAQQQNATLVEYAFAAKSKLAIWVIQPNGTITFRQADLSPLQTSLAALAQDTNAAIGKQSRDETDATLTTLVQGTRSAIGLYSSATTRSGDNTPAADTPNLPPITDGLKQLHQILIQPIQDLLPTNPNDHVIFIPQGNLFLVPFPALQAPDGSYLVQHHTIRTAPSIQVLALTQQQRQRLLNQTQQDKLIVGNPTKDLEAAEAEAKAVADLFSTQPLLREAATELAVTQRMPHARLIHLATHGALNKLDPIYWGSLRLAGSGQFGETPPETDGILTTSEVVNLKLQAELVVLSGCDTGTGNISSDGVVGLSRSFLTAGTPSIIMSLWRVPDAPTAELMTTFYRFWHPANRWQSSGIWLLFALVGLLVGLRQQLRGWKLTALTQTNWQQVPARLFVMLRQVAQTTIAVCLDYGKRMRRMNWKQTVTLSVPRKRVGQLAQSISRLRIRAFLQFLWQRCRLWRDKTGMPVRDRRWVMAMIVLGSVVLLVSMAQLQQSQPLDKAQALRQAMLTTMQDHPAPRDWAAFTLMGEAQ